MNLTLTPSEMRRFAHQISLTEIGLEGQEILKQSEVTICGLDGIGVTVMRCLLATGVGRVRIIDSGFITEDWLPEQTLFGVGDVGKMRSIAAREKKFGGVNDQSINLYSTKFHKNNTDVLMGKSKILVETLHRSMLSSEMMDYADEQNIDVFSAFCMVKKGAFGLYSDNRKKEFREMINNINFKISNDYYGLPFCFSSVSSFIGGIMACNVIKLLLGMYHKDSELYEIETINFSLNKLL
ncbi:MAG: ThiF family adenylyltransferase [Prevotellaceae bacterium]|nr:ThiF family adenylyltransferase [Prevotellaceae bacterium]